MTDQPLDLAGIKARCEGCRTNSKYGAAATEDIHIIIAYDLPACVAEIEKLRKALEFYAAEGAYRDDASPSPAMDLVPWSAPIWSDIGRIARAALGEDHG